MMGGTIDATSQPGVGSTFLVCLPLVRAEQPKAESPEAGRILRPDDSLETDGQDVIAILLAEDHPMNQRIVQIILEPLGFAVTVAADGVEAVEAWQRARFDLILMDMQMPNLDGLAATRKIRQLEAETGRARTPIAMLSANAMPEHQLAALEAGCDIHISKPVTPDSLCAGIEALLAPPADEMQPIVDAA
jgi:CheY-like chemotaxis protein